MAFALPGWTSPRVRNRMRESSALPAVRPLVGRSASLGIDLRHARFTRKQRQASRRTRLLQASAWSTSTASRLPQMAVDRLLV